MKKIIKFTSKNSELIQKAFEIRTVVFVEEQNVDKDIEWDGFDDEAMHYILYYNGMPAGTCRRRETDKGIKLERLAVLKNFRGKGIGTILMKEMLDDILPTDKTVYLNAQVNIMSIYENLGFERVGDMFTEANIEHYKMIYNPEKRK